MEKYNYHKTKCNKSVCFLPKKMQMPSVRRRSSELDCHLGEVPSDGSHQASSVEVQVRHLLTVSYQQDLHWPWELLAEPQDPLLRGKQGNLKGMSNWKSFELKIQS